MELTPKKRPFRLTMRQREIISLLKGRESPCLWLKGKAGCGKTTAAVAWVQEILDRGPAWPNILIFAPTRTYGAVYQNLISGDGIRPQLTTYNGFVQQSLNLFWPLISEKAGFAAPHREPVFLTIETSQVVMAKLVQQKVDAGYFNALTGSKARLFNQIMLSMHKCATAMIPYENYAARMSSAWTGDPSLKGIFSQAQDCGMAFRALCLENNLLDYALQLEIYNDILLKEAVYLEWLRNRQFHFVFDNAEEEVPAAHHFASVLLKNCQSALIITDSDGGYREFLGCDLVSAEALGASCEETAELNDTFIASPSVESMEKLIRDPYLPESSLKAVPRTAFHYCSCRQYPAMIKQAAADVAELIRVKNVPPSEIVLLAPLVSDVLYTSLERSLKEQGVNVFLNRPSRPLINEPITHSLITLCLLAEPRKGYPVRRLDIAQMIETLIEGMDPMRAQILAARAFAVKNLGEAETDSEGGDDPEYRLIPYESVNSEFRARIPKPLADSFVKFQNWLGEARKAKYAPHKLLRKYFADLMIREGFRSDEKTVSGLQKVVQSMEKFDRMQRDTRKMAADKGTLLDERLPDWVDFFIMVRMGMVSASYHETSEKQPDGTVLISLTSAYLSMDRCSDYQIWLNAGSPRWWERFYGQLTNDEILSQNWNEGDTWDALNAAESNNAHMQKVICGLLRRCRSQVRVYSSEISEDGLFQKSRLLNLFAELSYRCQKGTSLASSFVEIPEGSRKEEAVHLEGREERS